MTENERAAVAKALYGLADALNALGNSIRPVSVRELAAREGGIGRLNLSVRARRGLERNGIASLDELCARSADQLLDIRNFGMTSLHEIRTKLAEIGLRLLNDSSPKCS